MNKFDFNKTYNKLNEAFDFGKELENIDSNSLTADVPILLLYSGISRIEELDTEALKKFSEWCLSLVDTPEKMKKALIDFAKFFLYEEGTGEIRKAVYHYNDGAEKKYWPLTVWDSDDTDDHISTILHLEGCFEKLYESAKPTPLNCSKEAIALGLMLDGDILNFGDDTFVLSLDGSIAWEYEEDDPDTGYYGGARVAGYTLEALSVMRGDMVNNQYDTICDFELYTWERIPNSWRSKYKFVLENSEIYNLYSPFYGKYINDNESDLPTPFND